MCDAAQNSSMVLVAMNLKVEQTYETNDPAAESQAWLIFVHQHASDTTFRPRLWDKNTTVVIHNTHRMCSNTHQVQYTLDTLHAH